MACFYSCIRNCIKYSIFQEAFQCTKMHLCIINRGHFYLHFYCIDMKSITHIPSPKTQIMKGYMPYARSHTIYFLLPYALVHIPNLRCGVNKTFVVLMFDNLLDTKLQEVLICMLQKVVRMIID